MEEIACPQCRMVNAATSSFCSRCGAPLGGAQPAATPGASGWELATAGMASPPPPVGPGGPLRKEECAGWWQRLGASILDGLFVGLLALLIFALLALVVWAVAPDAFEGVGDWFEDEGAYSEPYDPYGTYDETSSDDPPDAFFALFGLAVLAFAAMSVAWEAWWTRSRHMAKPGQMIAGFRVVTATGVERVSTGRAIGRGAAKLLYNIPNLGGLISLASAFTIGLTEKKQAIHDMISGTACVRKSALERRGVGPDAREAGIGGVPSMQQHVAAAPNRGTTEGPPPPSSGPFV